MFLFCTISQHLRKFYPGIFIFGAICKKIVLRKFPTIRYLVGIVPEMLRCSSLSEVCTFDDVTDWVSRVGEWMAAKRTHYRCTGSGEW